jgi:hypothetical protein
MISKEAANTAHAGCFATRTLAANDARGKPQNIGRIGDRRSMARRIGEMGCDLMLNSNQNEVSPAKWIHTQPGDVWYGRK